MNIVGVDLSLTATAIADVYGTRVFRSKLRGMERLHEISNVILKDADQDALVVIEGYAYGSARGASQQHSLGELGGVVRYRLWLAGIKVLNVPPAILKKYATGKGNATKSAVVSAAVKRSGIEFASDDEADAFWLRAIGCDLLGDPIVQVPSLNRTVIGTLEVA